MDHRELGVVLVGAIGLSLAMAPTSAAELSLSTGSKAETSSGLVLAPRVETLELSALVAGVVVPLAAASPVQGSGEEQSGAEDEGVAAETVRAAGTAAGRTVAVSRAAPAPPPVRSHGHRPAAAVGDVEVSAVNTGVLGTAVAASDGHHRSSDVEVTAVNTAILGTAVAMADGGHHDRGRPHQSTSQVTAVNTGILGTAVAVGSGGNGQTTAVNTGILGTAVAFSGGHSHDNGHGQPGLAVGL